MYSLNNFESDSDLIEKTANGSYIGRLYRNRASKRSKLKNKIISNFLE